MSPVERRSTSAIISISLKGYISVDITVTASGKGYHLLKPAQGNDKVSMTAVLFICNVCILYRERGYL